MTRKKNKSTPVTSMKILKEEPTSVPTFSCFSKVNPPRYNMLPTETDLHLPKRGTSVAYELELASEELVVNALVECESQPPNVIAHLAPLKQLFATSYSDDKFSIAVQRFGDTIVLSPTLGDINVDEANLLCNFRTLSLVQSCRCDPNSHPLIESEPPPTMQDLLNCEFEGLTLFVVNELLLAKSENGLTSLHLWDEKFTNATTWMDAWIGNVIANVPEVTVCYHEKGTVIDYLSLKTSEIPSEKGIVSADGMVLHHGLKVLRFLHLHCKEERTVYRLFRKDDELFLELPGGKIRQSPLTIRSSRVFQRFADKYLDKEDFDQAKTAYCNALATCKNFPPSRVAVLANLGLGRVETIRAEQLATKGAPAYMQVLMKASSYYEEAMSGVQAYPDDDELKQVIYKELGSHYTNYALLLSVHTAVVGTVEAAFQKAFRIYESTTLKETCRTEASQCYDYYSVFQRRICLQYLKKSKSSKASKGARVAEIYFRKSLECIAGPETDHLLFSSRLIEMASHYCDMYDMQPIPKTLKSAMSILLDCAKIPEEHEDAWKSNVVSLWTVLQRVLEELSTKHESGTKKLYEKVMQVSPSVSELKEIEDMWKTLSNA
ncbi:uncharacterized protein LOC108859557 isoform X2 [Raphanus sativus]|uniref:Uncharacterized protein LOC108859557 isoform X2 n=1 Tax=Raphanus sativus TaxID=3726 RepID=A0A9W3CUG8_RAPSA|nr:uncharacterized protein LOC108859557 isoform X2 [Raphanus sativus]